VGLLGLAVVEPETPLSRLRQRTGPGPSNLVVGEISWLPKPWCGRSSW